MRVLYAAIDQSVPAAHGGSVHVTSVAEGLSELGHDVHVLAAPGDAPFPAGRATWEALSPPLHNRRFRLLRAGVVTRRARELRSDAVIERYYNFGGEGLLAARRVGALAVLEVNAPVVDHPGSTKQLIDRLLVVQPMKRWREWQCRAADLIVTPSVRILPSDVPPGRVLQTEWGADTVRFHPGAAAAGLLPRRRGETVAIFVGAFRAWHGAIHLVEAIRRLRARGRSDITAVLIGDGPELSRVRRAAEGIGGITFIGALPHTDVPAYLAAADIGVAPFDVTAHPALMQEFYWSPLKVFEYMSSGLPVVAPRIARLATIIGDGREGLLYHPTDPRALADALQELADSPQRAALGAAARARAVEHYSWRSHCEALDRVMRGLLAARDARTPRR